MKQQIDKIIKNLPKSKTFENKTVIVAISGFGGSGKSTLAEVLQKELRNAKIISIDAFIINRLQQRSSDWDGFDRERFKVQVLEPASHGQSIDYDEYNWKENKIVGKQTIKELPKYLIVEGCSIIHPDLIKYYDFSIWIDYPLDLATQRGLKRDKGWGVDHDDLWLNLWKPNEEDFFNKYHPDKLANYIQPYKD
jgi:uridine kinase